MSDARQMISWLGALPVFMLGACAAIPDGQPPDPPHLALTAPDIPDVPIHPTKVTIKNGRGETLLDGTPDRDYRLSGNPPPDQFDGTLTVTTDYDNGTSKAQTLTHDPAKRVSLAWDKTLNQYVVTSVDAPTPTDSHKASGEPGWALQIFADYKQTPYGSTLVSSSGSAAVGSPDLSTGMGSLGVGFRRYFSTTASGIQPFVYAGFSEYFGNNVRVADVTYHFGGIPDSGGAIKEDRSFIAGLGGHFQLSPKIGLDLMAGVHATRMQVSVFSDERSGGGPYNEFSSNKWLFGPTLGGRLSLPLFLMRGSPVLAFMQYHAMLMDDVSHSGTSPFTSSTYSIRADGGIQHKIMFGLEKRF